jgi:hypothetical protein
MAGLPIGFPQQAPGGVSEFERQAYADREAAMQRLAAQAFQQSWYSFPFYLMGANTTVSSKPSWEEVEVIQLHESLQLSKQVLWLEVLWECFSPACDMMCQVHLLFLVVVEQKHLIT